MIPFRVYYTDGNIYDGEPWKAPIFRVLVIIERDPDHGRRIISGADYYCWDTELQRWRGYDQIGMIQYLSLPGPKRVLIGEMVDNALWNEIYRRAENDADFPLRTAYGVYENKGER